MIIIISIIVLLVIKLIYDKINQNIKIGKEGGMLNKYRQLVNLILDGHENSKVVRVSKDAIVVECRSISGIIYFRIVQAFGKVAIQWNVENIVNGKHRLEWSFPEYLNQEKMMLQILIDVDKYQQNTLI
jgi:hypothetical protein